MRLVDVDELELQAYEPQNDLAYAAGWNDCVDTIKVDICNMPTIDAIPVWWLREKMRNSAAAGAWHNVDTIKWLIESWQNGAQDAQREYEAAVEMTEYCERYEPTYNAEDGSE